MITRMIVTCLVVLSLSARLPVYSAVKPTTPQTMQDSQIEDVKSQIKRLGVGEAVTISLIDGKKFRGFLTRIGDSDFELRNSTRDVNFTFKYEEVIKVDRGIDFGFRKIQVGDDRTTQTTLESDSRAEAVKLQITSLGIGEYVRVSLIKGGKSYGKKFYGIITRVGDSDFEITEFSGDREVTFSIRYSDVKKVDGDRDRRTWLWVTGVAIVAVPVILGAVLISKKKFPDQKFPPPLIRP